MVVKDLDKTQDDAIMAEIDKAYQNKNAGRWEEAEKHYLHSWKLFPEPKYGWGMSQMMLYFLAEFYLEWKKYDLAKKWAQEVFKCEPNPGDGTPYLFLGKIHYEEGELDEARKHFEKAHEVSGRRVFQGEDPKYFKFLKEKGNDPMELEGDRYRKVTRLSERGNKYMEAEEWDKAIAVFDEALELLPEPKNQWEATLWLNTSIGDACFMKDDFVRAKEALFDALNCPDGTANPFVLIRLGEVLYELEDMEGAKEYLLRAYMLEGKEIFEAEDPKYLSYLEEHFDLEE